MSDSNATTILGPPVSYCTLLNHATKEHLRKEAESPTRRYFPLRPSSAGKCTRELAYALNEYYGNASYEKPVLEPESHRIFDLGHSIEYHVLKQFRERTGEFFEIRYKQQVLSFFQIQEPTPEQTLRWIEGSLDMCFVSPTHKGIGDVKSKKEKYSAYRQSDWDDMDEKLGRLKTVVPIGDDGTGWWVEDIEAFLVEVNDPFLAQNFWQLNFYACNPFIAERGIDHGFILQYSKNTSRLREIRFRPSQKLAERTRQKFELATAAVRGGDPAGAPRDFLLGSIKCAFCDYRRECWREEPGEPDPLKSYFKTLPPKKWPTDLDRLDEKYASSLRALYSDFAKAQAETVNADALETQIIDVMVAAGVRKIKFDDGHIYELRHYKSPKPRIALNRSKL